MPNRDLHHLRKNYNLGSITPAEVATNPYVQFDQWYHEAEKLLQNTEVNAMVLATATKDGKPSSRVVLLKQYKAEHGFVFYTNYESRKGEQLNENPSASLLFFWPELERQIRIEGIVDKISEEQSIEYFNSRPKESRISAIASPQSKAVEESYLENQIKKVKQENNLSKPKNWGGYRLIPNYFEFWQGKPNRLHDRIAYRLFKTSAWEIERIAP